MTWPFRRVPINPEPLSEGWRVGDLAETVQVGRWQNTDGTISSVGPMVGEICRVAAIQPKRSKFGDFWFFRLYGFGDDWYFAQRFRKVPPLDSAADQTFEKKIKEAARWSVFAES